MKKKIWKPVDGYEGSYEVSNKGRVRLARNGKVYKKGYILNGRIDKRFGYRYVDLYDGNGNAKRYSTHRLVLLAFVGQCPKGMESRHLNDIKTDNRLRNLKWGTRKENIADAFKNGIQMCGKGTKRSEETRRKLSVAHKGNKPSKETRKKLSIAMMGNSWNRGSELTRQHKENIGFGNRGKVRTEAHKRNYRIAKKKYYAKKLA